MLKQLASYAVPSPSIADVAAHLERELELKFTSHESPLWGQYLLCGGGAGLHIKIYFNRDPSWREGDPAAERYFQPDFPNYGVLVEVCLPAAAIDNVRVNLEAGFPGLAELAREVMEADEKV